MKNVGMIGILMIAGAFASTGCAHYSMTSDTPQRFASEEHPAYVSHDPPPAQAISLGKVRDSKNGMGSYGGTGGCEKDIGKAAAAQLGANFVQITNEGTRITWGAWASPYCEGQAFRVKAGLPLIFSH